MNIKTHLNTPVTYTNPSQHTGITSLDKTNWFWPLSLSLSLCYTHTHTLTRAVTSINSPILPLLPQCLEVGFCPVFSTLTPELYFFVTRNENVPKSQSVSIAVW